MDQPTLKLCRTAFGPAAWGAPDWPVRKHEKAEARRIAGRKRDVYPDHLWPVGSVGGPMPPAGVYHSNPKTRAHPRVMGFHRQMSLARCNSK